MIRVRLTRFRYAGAVSTCDAEVQERMNVFAGPRSANLEWKIWVVRAWNEIRTGDVAYLRGEKLNT